MTLPAFHDFQWAFAWAGLVVGTAVGATGVGGGSLMTPILILFYSIAPAVAVGTDLVYASISKAYGVVLHQRRRTVEWSIVGRLSIGSVPAALLASWWLLTQQGSVERLNNIIRLVLALAVITTAVFALFQETLLARVNGLRAHKIDGGFLVIHQWSLTVAAGMLIGAVVAISSVGAGVIGMMLLLLLYPKTPPIRLVGADLAHAVLITGIAGLAHAKMGTVNVGMLVPLLVGALPGIWIGTRIGFKLTGVALRRVIAIMLVVIGSTMLAKALHR